MTLVQMLERATQRMKVKHMQDLSEWIGVDRANMSHFRAGRLIPTDAQVVRLAALADVPAEHALIWIAHYRSQKRKQPAIVTRAWLRAKKLTDIAVRRERSNGTQQKQDPD